MAYTPYSLAIFMGALLGGLYWVLQEQNEANMFSILSKDPLGQIVLANMKCVYEQQFIERGRLIRFLKAWKAIYETHTPSSAGEIINLIPYIKDIDSEFRFRHSASPAMLNTVSTIIRWEDFVTLLDEQALNSVGISVEGDQFDENFFARLQDTFSKNPQVLKTNTYGNPCNFGQFWITPSEWLHTLKKLDSSCLADQVRDILGLVHFNSNVTLIEFYFSSKKIPPTNVATPTFIEAVDHRRFKAHDQPESNQYWGLTVHLQEESYLTKNINKGKPELLVKFMPITPDWKMNVIGHTSRMAEGINPDNDNTVFNKDQEFANALYSCDDFVTLLNNSI